MIQIKNIGTYNPMSGCRQSVQSPIDDLNRLEARGRGIFITRFQFDELEYLGKGNVVRAKKLARRQ